MPPTQLWIRDHRWCRAHGALLLLGTDAAVALAFTAGVARMA